MFFVKIVPKMRSTLINTFTNSRFLSTHSPLSSFVFRITRDEVAMGDCLEGTGLEQKVCLDVGSGEELGLFCFVLFCFVLFCFVLFCFVLFCFVLFFFACFSFLLSFCNTLFFIHFLFQYPQETKTLIKTILPLASLPQISLNHGESLSSLWVCKMNHEEIAVLDVDRKRVETRGELPYR